MSTWLLMSGPPLCIVWWKPGCPCMAVCLCPSHLISVATPCLECVHASVHEFMSTLHPMSGPPPMDSYMESWVPLCVTACVSQSPWLCPTPCLECVHASVHEFMSTWLLMSGPPPMHSLMETWVPLYGSVFVSQSSHFCCHTLFRMCTCISTWIYVFLPMSGPPPMNLLHMCLPCLECVPVHEFITPHFCCHTLFRMCTCISTWIYVYLTPHVWSTPYG